MICKLDIENDFNLVSPDSNEKIKSTDHRYYLSLTRTKFDLELGLDTTLHQRQ